MAHFVKLNQLDLTHDNSRNYTPVLLLILAGAMERVSVLKKHSMKFLISAKTVLKM